MNAATAIEQTFLHCPGVGPVTDARIKERGYGDWQTVLRQPEGLPLGARGSSTLLQALARSRDALARDDIQYLGTRPADPVFKTQPHLLRCR